MILPISEINYSKLVLKFVKMLEEYTGRSFVLNH